MRFWPSIRPYTAAALAVAFTGAIEFVLERTVGPGPPLLLYLPAVTFASWLGGLWPGLLATGLAAGACLLTHHLPDPSFSLSNPHDRARLAVFLAEGVLLSGTMAMLHEARRRAEASECQVREFQEELSRSEARLRAILDNSPSAIFLKDLDGRYLLANRRIEVFAGPSTPPGPVEGRLDVELFPPEQARRFRQSDRAAARSGKVIEIEDHIEEKDGTHTYLTVKFPLKDDDGTVYAVGGIATDITERTRAEQALRASERRFRTLCQHAPIGIFLTDAEGNMTYANPRCEMIYGFSEPDALGEGWFRYVHPDDQPAVIEQWRRLAKAGANFAMEYRAMTPDGAIRWVNDQTVPLLSDEGEKVGHVGTVEDVTERRQAEIELRRERDFAKGLIATARAIVLVIDGSGRVVLVNPFVEHVTGRPADDLKGRDWFAAAVPQDQRDRAREATMRALSGETGEPIIYPVSGPNGRFHRLEWANRAVLGPGGETCVLAIGHDITALEEAQQRALHAERLAAIGEMVAGISHESRNALHRCQVCLEMLAIEVEDLPPALQLIDRIQAAQDTLYHVFEDVRTYAAPIILERRACDLTEVWRTVWAQITAGRTSRVAELIEDLDGAVPRCSGDPFRLGQVFRNILDNALDAAPEPARVEIACEPASLDGEPAIRVAVRDNGPGLGPEQRRRIFEPFFTTKARGTGLGMAITRRIVEAHGGRITVGEGARPGAEIIVTLPRDLI